VNTHTANRDTHPEQWAAVILWCPVEWLG